jgi:deferrochelatase/peroxidase EfeB
VRRGRPYGEPIADPLDPARFLPRLPELIANPPPGGPRGLQFQCFNTNLSRQFEFVQATWVNNPRFSEGRDAPDPLLGPGGSFELPSVPLARRVEQLPRFVTTRGGAYFFMPGLRALARIAGE